MQAEPMKIEPDVESPASYTVASNSPPSNGLSNGQAAPNSGASAPQTGAANDHIPPSKTDKPRPHQCNVCNRCFARLEHLKRHERSHTKEKPFECPDCLRCFARRDLLLRHQQKLHQSGNPSRPRVGRRESATGSVTNGGRVRKNSVLNTGMGHVGMRPRANTLAHIDVAHLDPVRLARIDPRMHVDVHNLLVPSNLDFNSMQNSMGTHANFHAVPKLHIDTHMHNEDISNTLRTAPATITNFHGLDDQMNFAANNTINPAALHGNDVSLSATMPLYDPNVALMNTGEDFSFMRDLGLGGHMYSTHESGHDVFEESSPSRMSSGSPSAGFPESMNNSHVTLPTQNDYWLAPQDGLPQHHNPGVPVDALGNNLAHLGMMGETVSPSHLHPTNSGEAYFQQQQPMMQYNGQNQSPAHILPHKAQQVPRPHSEQSQQMHNQQQMTFGYALSPFDSNSPSISSSSIAGSVCARQSSLTSMSTDSITESTRQAILNTLQQPSVYGGHLYRKFSQPSISSPLSPVGRTGSQSMGAELPSTADIRKYIDAFIQYAHPHLPMIHYHTLSFECIEIPSSMRSPSPGTQMVDHNTVGTKCLLLSMAAIGALYEYEHAASKQLFDAGRKIVALFLESQRKREMTGRQRSGSTEPPQAPPLWLVQSMLLGVIYGHHCGEQPAAQSASQGIPSLIQLMRAAKVSQLFNPDAEGDFQMNDDEDENQLTRYTTDQAYIHGQWLKWKHKEEKIRCFFAMFFVSSVLMIAYNQSPTIMNSEVVLCLPCEEHLYNASSAEEWHSRGGLAAVHPQKGVSFKEALGALLDPALQKKFASHGSSHRPLDALCSNPTFSDGEMRPSTFGCLILIAALHNYIWETRARHEGPTWTQKELTGLVNVVEPALKAWHVAWRANEHHRMERPNPYNLGPLAADCIPLMDLAFVRLYVDLGQTTVAFWARDFEAMAVELGKKDGIVAPMEDDTTDDATSHAPSNQMAIAQSMREKQLRKSALYAADSLKLACTYNLTYADPSVSPELPIQSGICFLDCVQVLAEWATVVQERVGPHLGVLGRDAVDLKGMPAVMLLTELDVHLLETIQEICELLEQKRLQEASYVAVEIDNFNPAGATNGANALAAPPELNLSGYGFAGRLTRVASMMLKKAIIWPVTQVMARALEVEGEFLDRRAEASVLHTH